MVGSKKGSKHSGYGMSRFSWFLHLRRFLLAQPGYKFEDARGAAYRGTGVFNIGGRYVNSAGYQVDQMVKEGLLYAHRARGGTYSLSLTKRGLAYVPNKDIVRSATWLMQVKADLAAGRTPPPRPKSYVTNAEGETLIEAWLADDRSADKGDKSRILPRAGNQPEEVDARPLSAPVTDMDDAEALAAAIVAEVVRRANVAPATSDVTFDQATAADNQRLRMDNAELKREIAVMRERKELAERNLQTLIDNLADEKAETELAHSIGENGQVTATPLLDRLSDTSRAELAQLMKAPPRGVTT